VNSKVERGGHDISLPLTQYGHHLLPIDSAARRAFDAVAFASAIAAHRELMASLGKGG
jgi:hypothetical protein